MLICHCRAINDRKIRQAALDGAVTVAQVRRATGGAGGCCGGCVPAIAEILEKTRPLPVIGFESQILEPEELAAAAE